MFAFVLLAVFALDSPQEYKSAQAESAKTGKPLVVFVTIDRCVPCEKLKKQISKLNTSGIIVGVMNMSLLNSKGTALYQKPYDEMKLKKGFPQLTGYKKNGGKWFQSNPKSKSDKDLQAWFNMLRIKNVPDPVRPDVFRNGIPGGCR